MRSPCTTGARADSEQPPRPSSELVDAPIGLEIVRATRIPGAERQTLHELSKLEDFRECDEDSHGVHDDTIWPAERLPSRAAGGETWHGDVGIERF